MPIQTASETEAVYLFNADTGKTIMGFTRMREEACLQLSLIHIPYSPYSPL